VSEFEGLEAVPIEHIARSILVLRGKRVLLDADLAALYGVPTKHFNQQVRRNVERFPRDFMFQIRKEEVEGLRSQIVTLKSGRGQHRKYLPFAFTEHGAIMAASILSTVRAVEVSVHVVRAFVQLREVVASHAEIAKKVGHLERKTDSHEQAIVGILNKLHEQMNSTQTRAIGFTADLERKR
jgi:phage regulator Rha-like protein